MKRIHVVTPVKDSIELTIQTARAIMSSLTRVPFTYTIYNDFSSEENTIILQRESESLGFELINLCDYTQTPSPNYLLVLQMIQKRAIKENADIIIIESDVVVKENTIESLHRFSNRVEKCGIAASVTVDEKGEINFPYLYAKGKENSEFQTNKRLSFCCSLLTNEFIKTYDFKD